MRYSDMVTLVILGSAVSGHVSGGGVALETDLQEGGILCFQS